MTKDVMTKGEKLYYLRTYNKLTIRECAKMVGTSETNWAQTERNLSFSLELQKKITTAFNLPSDFFNYPMQVVLNGAKIWNIQETKDRVIMLRLFSGKTCTKLSSELGVARQLISAIEQGTRLPSKELTRRLTEYFGLPQYFFTFQVST